MAHPRTPTTSLDEGRGETKACRPRSGRSEATFLRTGLGDRQDQILALLRARGLRFRDGSRWREATTSQVHRIGEATVA
ncbi:hypothetical protein [Salinispora oceanensis]|uniref:hypothetical protein n=1 Tax=Salinispora oceanensis TaxID=1050199 RepID=UPI00035F0930|nr:hypothetical protein [Salinispora oceanensis]